MRVPLSWLSEFVNIKDKPEVLAEKLQFAGTKVETIEKSGDESIFITEITSNRPDCLSVYGTAREVAAITGETLARPLWHLPKREETSRTLKIHVAEPELCPVYTSIILDNVSVKPSPPWLVKRLEQVGVRSINNIVDITNYVMFEYGMPMHTFDFDTIEGGELIIRGSRAGEKVTPLDGVERSLQAGTIVIEDAKKLVDLAGIMGGENSETSEKTTTIFLHVAVYDPIAIRKASKHLGLRSESSTRFEKKLDLLGTRLAMNRAALLIMELSGAEIASETYEFNQAKHQSPVIVLQGQHIEKFVGVTIPKETLEKILTRLEFSPEIVEVKDDFELSVIPPSFRRDVTLAQDVIEEIVRIYGYNNLPMTLPEGTMPEHKEDPVGDLVRQTKNTLVGLGFTEVYGSTLTGEDVLVHTRISPDDSLAVLHPMSKDYSAMRPTLVAGMLQMVRENLFHVPAVHIFEMGKVFLKEKKEGVLPRQPEWLGIVTTEENYAVFKGKVERLFLELGVSIQIEVEDSQIPPYFLASKTARIGDIGWIGVIDPAVSTAFGITKEILAAEVDVKKLLCYFQPYLPYPAIYQHPPIYEDITFVLLPRMHLGPIVSAIYGLSDLVVKVTFVVQYENAWTFRLTYQHSNKTLSSNEVADLREKMVGLVEKEFGAKVKR